MIQQEIDGIRYKLKAPYDFDFLHDFGRVFKVFDDQDSGNIGFGIINGSQKLFLKYAGAPTAEYSGDLEEAVDRLKACVPLYRSIHHPALIRLLYAKPMGQGYGLCFEWAEGECMGRMYPESHRQVMDLPIDHKLTIFSTILDFMIATAEAGYVAIDFYDGSILVDINDNTIAICDIDFFRKNPTINEMGRMWGSARFMAPEEYERGAVIDEITNVFTCGQMAFSLLTDSHREYSSWPLSTLTYEVVLKAIEPDRSKRFPSLLAFKTAWNSALLELRSQKANIGNARRSHD